jgi:hypothetical protein
LSAPLIIADEQGPLSSAGTLRERGHLLSSPVRV